MIIDRHTAPYIVFADDTILAALNKIGANKSGVVFSVDEHGLLQGSFSDGDFRRWVTSQPSIDLGESVRTVAQPSCVRAPLTSDTTVLTALFRPGVEVIPLVDERGHVAAVAIQGFTGRRSIRRRTVPARRRRRGRR